MRVTRNWRRPGIGDFTVNRHFSGLSGRLEKIQSLTEKPEKLLLSIVLFFVKSKGVKEFRWFVLQLLLHSE